MLKVLQNPKTQEYINLKNHILSEDFPWYFRKESTKIYSEDYVNISFFSHIILERAEDGDGHAQSCSNLSNKATLVIKEILSENNINLITFLRMNVNLVYPYPTVVNTVPHFDHPYKHKNVLVYLTSAGGKTIIEGEEHDPQEDDVVVFQGEHYHQTPVSERRMVLVATFIDEEML